MEEFYVKKQKLKENSENYKKEFAEDLSDFTSTLERGLVTGLIAGGIAVVGYKILEKTLFKEEKEVQTAKVHNEGSLSQIPKILVESAVIFLLNLAKEKLLEYLRERNNNVEAKEDTKGNQ